jgi:hypothetical protein
MLFCSFFSNGPIVPSPDDIGLSVRRTLISRFREVEETCTVVGTVGTNITTNKRNVFCNTELSFPQNLPPHVEQLLESYIQVS